MGLMAPGILSGGDSGGGGLFDSLPDIGIGADTAGSAVGAAAGSMFGPLGMLAGGALGGMAGGAIGDAAGGISDFVGGLGLGDMAGAAAGAAAPLLPLAGMFLSDASLKRGVRPITGALDLLATL